MKQIDAWLGMTQLKVQYSNTCRL